MFRIEDTDAARDPEESHQAIRGAALAGPWDWDEGPGSVGRKAPYRQSQRSEIYRDVIARLRRGRRGLPGVSPTPRR